MSESDNPPSHQAQIAGLTLSVSRHEELLESLKEVPSMLKKLVGTRDSGDLDDTGELYSEDDDMDRMLGLGDAAKGRHSKRSS